MAALDKSGLFLPDWYSEAYRSVLPSGSDALIDFCDGGWRAGRLPNPYFDPAWYLEVNQDVREAGHNPLLHYFYDGEREGRRPIPFLDPVWYRRTYGVPADELCLVHFLAHRHTGRVSPMPEFDPEFYLLTNPDVAAARIDPFEHYLHQGHREDRNPSAGFDTATYRRMHMPPGEVLNPLMHFVRHRPEQATASTQEDIATVAREVRRSTQVGPHFETRRALPQGAEPRAKLLAYYLPQFHAIPENDGWWGTGFTEWANVARGLPRFAGHYQPRIPRDLGPYDLSSPHILGRQVAMARDAGIFGFVFYFYWFNGRRLLEKPVENFLSETDLVFPFCLMWANENWTRRWDGSDDEVLITQDYRETDEPALLASFVRHFADPRYIRVQGRPLLLIYRPSLIPNATESVCRWRRMFREAHGEDPLLIMSQSFDQQDPRIFGLDAAIEFPPHKLTRDLRPLNPTLSILDPDFRAQVFAYDEMITASIAEPAPDYPLIKTVVPGWDNDARRQGAGLVLHDATPAKYQGWLDRLVRRSGQHRFLGECFVAVNAWNEWAEGAYLEPDLHFGAAYLNATGRAVAGLGPVAERGKLVLVGHDAFRAGAQMLLLGIAEQLVRVHGAQIAVLLLGGGELEACYAEVAETFVLASPTELTMRAAQLQKRGVRSALINSSAAAAACPQLNQAGIACTLLVHEMPGLIREKNLIEGVINGVATSRRLVFAAPVVRDSFLALTGADPARSVILPQGLYRPVTFSPEARQRLRHALGITSETTLAIGVGYADLRKGFDLFLQVWREVTRSGAPIHLCWIGEMDPTLRRYLGPEIEVACTRGTLHLPGFRDDAADWFCAADVHLLTSREDPFPSVALEAMSAGLPTIAFAGTGGIPDLLARLDTGMAVPLGDAVAMAEAVIGMSADQPNCVATSRRDELAALVRREFAFDQYVADLLRIAAPALRQVSVVVPSYNSARYLGHRLASIFSQTYPMLEVIVLDDGSTDESEAVAQETAEGWMRRIQFVGSGTNSGSVFRQWRRAAEMARGEYLWIAEADDASDPRFIECLVEAVETAAKPILAFCDSRAIDAENAQVSSSYKDYYGVGTLAQDTVLPARDFLRMHLTERNLILNASAVLWHRGAMLGAMERCGAELLEFRPAGDWRLYTELLDRDDGEVVYVAEPLNVHRRHAASVTATTDMTRHLSEIARMHRLLASRVPDPLLPARQARALADVAARLSESVDGPEQLIPSATTRAI